jgi:hypothetical protein
VNQPDKDRTQNLADKQSSGGQSFTTCWMWHRSVAFGQRAPNRATAREEGRGLGAGMKGGSGAAIQPPRSPAQPRNRDRYAVLRVDDPRGSHEGICKLSWPTHPWCFRVDLSADVEIVAFLSEVPQGMVCTGGCTQAIAAVCNLWIQL